MVFDDTVSAQVSKPFTYPIAVSGVPTNFSASGLPAGLSVNSVTGIIIGVPTTAGTYSATISAANKIGTGNTATLLITVIKIILKPAQK